MTREEREKLADLVESLADIGTETGGPAGWVSPLAPGEPEALIAAAAEIRKTCSDCKFFDAADRHGIASDGYGSCLSWFDDVPHDGSGFCHCWESKSPAPPANTEGGNNQ